jgi:Ger(x)C family germination protein
MVSLHTANKDQKGGSTMKKKLYIAICIIVISMVVTGCWDIHYLTNKKIVNGISVDIDQDNHMKGTVRAIILKSKGGGQFDVKDEFVQATGDSITSIGSKIDSMLPGTVEASKTHVIMIGEELAKKGILTPLESIYRNPKGFLASKIIISEGLASEVLSYQNIENNPIAFGIMQMIRGSVRNSSVPKLTLFTLWSQITDPGEDAILPMIRKVKNKSLAINSIALFHGDKFTGVTLSQKESTLLLLLKDNLNKLAVLHIPYQIGSEQGNSSDEKSSVISFQAQKLKRSFKVTVDEETQEISCSIKLDIYGALMSYPTHMNQKVDREQLNLIIAKELNKQATEVTSKLLKANCDALGIGRRLRVDYSDLWRQINWEQEYSSVKFNSDIQVHIKNTGVIS